MTFEILTDTFRLWTMGVHDRHPATEFQDDKLAKAARALVRKRIGYAARVAA